MRARIIDVEPPGILDVHGAGSTRIGKALQGVFGSANKRSLSRFQPIVRAVNALADEIKALSKEQIQAQVATMKQKVMAGETTLDDCLPRMFALTREAATRTLGIRHFDVQLLGGAVLLLSAVLVMRHQSSGQPG